MTPDTVAGLRQIPVWVRITVLGVVVLLFTASALLVIASVGDADREAWVAPATALAETASTGFLVVLIMFFAERHRTLPRIEAVTERVLTRDLPRAFRRLSLPAAGFYEWQEGAVAYSEKHEAQIRIAISHARGALRATYQLTFEGEQLVMGVELNVRRLNVIYTLPLAPGETAEIAFQKLDDTLNGARSAGYNNDGAAYDSTLRRQPIAQRLNAACIASMTLHRDLDDDFTLSPTQQQFVLQDLAIMTFSLIRERKATKPAEATPPAQTTTAER